MNKVSVIIPVFNEEKTVAGVIEAVLASNLASEIICVNDGSSDNSLSILKSFANKIRLIDLGKNQGKGYALAVGAKTAKEDIIVFLDSDHPNLSPNHVKDLIEPVLNQGFKAAVGLALSDATSKFYKLLIGFLIRLNAYTGGQRVYLKKDILPHIDQIAETGYGAELFLNNLIAPEKIKFVPLNGLLAINKDKKWPLPIAFKKWIVFNIQLAKQVFKKLFNLR